MVMPSSGPISIGQARNECGLGNPINAGHPTISRLARVGSGQRYAWSYWRGRSNLTQYNDVAAFRFRFQIDHQGQSWHNFRTGEYGVVQQDSKPWQTWYVIDNYFLPSPIPGIEGYSTLSARIGPKLGGNKGEDRPWRTILEQPSASNDYTFRVQWNDPMGGEAWAQFDLYLTALS